jgi:hypothetical protein
MIKNYNTYITESKKDNNFYLKFNFNATNNKFLINYDISFNEVFDVNRKSIYSFINKLIENIFKKVFKDINTSAKYIILNKTETIYFLSILLTYNFDLHNNDKLEYYFIRNKTNKYDIITTAKKFNYNEFKEIFDNISFEQNNINNYFIKSIEKNNDLYFNKIFRTTYSKKVINMFKYLEDAKKFDLL